MASMKSAEFTVNQCFPVRCVLTPTSMSMRHALVLQATHAGIGVDVWAVDAQTAHIIEEALALGDELTLSVRQGMPLRFSRHQVMAAFVSPIDALRRLTTFAQWHLRPHLWCLVCERR